MPVETMADDIDDVDALLEEPYQKVSVSLNADFWMRFGPLKNQKKNIIIIYKCIFTCIAHEPVKLTGVPFVSQVSPGLSSATSAQVALPLLIGAVLKTL